VSNSMEVNATLPMLRVVQPTEGDGYLIVARELLPAVEALATLPQIPPRAAASLAGHTLECALKAFLWHAGEGAALRDRKVQHNLLALWALAYKAGLLIPETPPDWCAILSDGHGPNFYFRYQMGKAGTVVHGGQSPALIPMTDALKKLVKMVEVAVKG
jgi:hypothetical protein